mmetsp:Transcript_27623/g.77215  ORF Transcript_27623/g.77215 Transcript_27623/m.77215 type:complete len:209 (+) Transcript_27623:1538-2164(+)
MSRGLRTGTTITPAASIAVRRPPHELPGETGIPWATWNDVSPQTRVPQHDAPLPSSLTPRTSTRASAIGGPPGASRRRSCHCSPMPREPRLPSPVFHPRGTLACRGSPSPTIPRRVLPRSNARPASRSRRGPLSKQVSSTANAGTPSVGTRNAASVPHRGSLVRGTGSVSAAWAGHNSATAFAAADGAALVVTLASSSSGTGTRRARA